MVLETPIGLRNSPYGFYIYHLEQLPIGDVPIAVHVVYPEGDWKEDNLMLKLIIGSQQPFLRDFAT